MSNESKRQHDTLEIVLPPNRRPAESEPDPRSADDRETRALRIRGRVKAGGRVLSSRDHSSL